MSLTLKIGSLVIRTLAKPMGNYIKRNAREHETFRRICVGFAQRLHRIDMRMRLGLLQDPAVIDRQIAREVADAEAKRRRDEAPTVKTEEQTKADEAQKKKDREEATDKVKKNRAPIRIRPLSESKAIDTGANFISESFLFTVAAGIILFESWRSRRKESNRRDDVDEKLETLYDKIRALEIKLQAERQNNMSLTQDRQNSPPETKAKLEAVEKMEVKESSVPAPSTKT